MDTFIIVLYDLYIKLCTYILLYDCTLYIIGFSESIIINNILGLLGVGLQVHMCVCVCIIICVLWPDLELARSHWQQYRDAYICTVHTPQCKHLHTTIATYTHLWPHLCRKLLPLMQNCDVVTNNLRERCRPGHPRNNGHETGDNNPVNNQLNTAQHVVQAPLGMRTRHVTANTSCITSYI